MRILGVDPGIATVGFSILDADRGRQALLCCGVISTSAGTNLSSRLDRIYSDLEEPSYLDPEVARWSDILLYDGMWDKRDPSLELHRGWGHSTWQDGVEYAKEERVQKLIITHHDPKVGDHELRERENLAQEDFARVSFARAGDIIEI